LQRELKEIFVDLDYFKLCFRSPRFKRW